MNITEKLLSVPKLWERENDIIQWGVDRNIIGDNAQATFESQQEKTRQEWGEWKRDHSMDDCGDIAVTLMMGLALQGTTLSSACKFYFECGEALGWGYDRLPKESLDIWLDYFLDFSVENYLTDNYDGEEWAAQIVHDLYHLCIYRGWTFEECLEVAWEDIKDRKGKMVHQMYIKQKDLDALSELGVEVMEKGGEVFFAGLIFLDSHLQCLNKIFYILGITFEQEGVYVKSTGRI